MQEVRILDELRTEISEVIKMYDAELNYFRRAKEKMHTKYNLIIDDSELYAKYATICYKEALAKVERLLEPYKTL